MTGIVIGPEYRALQNSRFTRKWESVQPDKWVLRFKFLSYYVTCSGYSRKRWEAYASSGNAYEGWTISEHEKAIDAFDAVDRHAKEMELLRDIDTVIRPALGEEDCHV